MKKTSLILTLLILIGISIVLGICLGSVRIPIHKIINIISTKDLKNSYWYIILKLRLPRTLGAIIVGAGLACSGLIFQAVFKNPMADSYMLGISSSSSFSICLAFLLLKNINSSTIMSMFAFLGSILCSIILFSMNRKNTLKLLLSGIAMNFFFSASTTLLIFLNRKQLDTILFWTMGSLASLDYKRILLLLLITIISIVITFKERNTLDLLLFNDEIARSSGINIERKKISLLILASLTTSVIVAFCGVIGFVGMLSSHLIRLILGPKHSKIIFPSILMGSLILVLSDIVSRTVISPSELPIGVISSVLGAPLLFILIKRKKTWIQ